MTAANIMPAITVRLPSVAAVPSEAVTGYRQVWMVGQVGMYGEALPQFSPLSRTGCGDRAGGAQPTGPGVCTD